MPEPIANKFLIDLIGENPNFSMAELIKPVRVSLSVILNRIK
jgi:hypothetical protein